MKKIYMIVSVAFLVSTIPYVSFASTATWYGSNQLAGYENNDEKSKYDEFNEKAHHNNKLSPPETIKNANILKQAMEKAGFQSIATEWWHYQDPDSKKFPVLDIPLINL